MNKKERTSKQSKSYLCCIFYLFWVVSIFLCCLLA